MWRIIGSGFGQQFTINAQFSNGNSFVVWLANSLFEKATFYNRPHRNRFIAKY